MATAMWMMEKDFHEIMIHKIMAIAMWMMEKDFHEFLQIGLELIKSSIW